MSDEQKPVVKKQKKETVREQAKRMGISISKVRKLRQGTLRYAEVEK